MVGDAELQVFIDKVKAIRAAEIAEGAPAFMGIPDRWYDALRWRCVNGHVTGHIIKSEEFGCDICGICREPVMLTFPEDKGGPLP